MSDTQSFSSGIQTLKYPKSPPPSTDGEVPQSDYNDLRVRSTRHAYDSQDDSRYSPVSHSPSTKSTASDYSKPTNIRPSTNCGGDSTDYLSCRSSEMSQYGSLRRSNQGENEDEHRPNAPQSPETPVSRRSSSSSSVSSSIQKITEGAIEKVEQARRTWNRFFHVWGAVIVLMLVLLTSAYYGRTTASNTTNLVRQLHGQFSSSLENLKQVAEHKAFISSSFNITSQLEPIWKQYSEMLGNTEYEHWFDDVRDAEDVITALWNTLPRNENRTADEIQQIAKMKSYIDYRAAQRKRAEVNFENFLLARSRVVKEMLQLSSAWSTYVNTTLGPSHSSPVPVLGGVRAVFEPPLSVVSDGKEPFLPGNSTSHLLNHAALGLLNGMINIHKSLYVVPEFPKTTAKGNLTWPETFNAISHESMNEETRLWSLSDVSSALELEDKFIANLLTQSSNAHLWDNGRCHSWSMLTLKKNLETLQSKLNRIEHHLTRLKSRMESEIVAEGLQSTPKLTGAPRNRLIWIQEAQGLTGSWNRMLERPFEARQLAQKRFAELQLETAQSESRHQLARWRSENCGGTTCFDVLPDGVWGRFVGAAQNGLGMRGSANSKKPFAKELDGERRELRDGQGSVVGLIETADRGRYEKECCGNARDNTWLDLLRFGATDLVYLSPYRTSGYQGLAKGNAQE